MAKITKRPQPVEVNYERVHEIRYIPSYKCPSCHHGFKGYGPSKNVTRFICECGQELMVMKWRGIDG